MISYMKIPLPLETTLTLFCIMAGNTFQYEKKKKKKNVVVFYGDISRCGVFLTITSQWWANECSRWPRMETFTYLAVLPRIVFSIALD